MEGTFLNIDKDIKNNGSAFVKVVALIVL